ncbi:MAG: type II toxin-antitoxin system RelE/ParE family toxin [Pseudomonadota bacterium]
MKPVVPRLVAGRDIEDAVDYYATTAGDAVALRFVGNVEEAFRQIGGNPSIGSLRYAYELGLPELRFRILREFPYLIFYIERPSHVDVWRVLHGHRDIPIWLSQPDQS